MRHGIPRVLWIAYLTIGLWILAMPAAHAYIDPASGSLIFQTVVAGIMAAGFVIKLKWQRFRSFFKKSDTSSVDTT